MYRFASVFVLFVCSAVLVSADTPVPFTNCGSSSDLLQNVKLTADNWPLKSTFTIYVGGALTQGVANGTVYITATLLGIKVLDQAYSLTELNVNPPIPVPAGPVTLTYTENIGITPPSGVKIHIFANDTLGNELVCLNVVTTLSESETEKLAVYADPVVDFSVACQQDKKALMPILDIRATSWALNANAATYTLTAKFSGVAQPLTAGTSHSTIAINGLVVEDADENLDYEFALPITSHDPFLQDISVTIPQFSPNGNYAATISGTDETGALLFCAEVQFRFQN